MLLEGIGYVSVDGGRKQMNQYLQTNYAGFGKAMEKFLFQVSRINKEV